MRVTSKGQVTIPKPVRDKLGIGPGSDVDFIDRENGVELVRSSGRTDTNQRRKEITAALLAMRGVIDLSGLTTDEFMELVRGPRDDLDPR